MHLIVVIGLLEFKAPVVISGGDNVAMVVLMDGSEIHGNLSSFDLQLR